MAPNAAPNAALLCRSGAAATRDATRKCRRGSEGTVAPAALLQNSRVRSSTQKDLQRIRFERPVELPIGVGVTQHRHARAVAALEFLVAVDPGALELRRAGGRQQRERVVAQRAIVALEQDQAHSGSGHGKGLE